MHGINIAKVLRFKTKMEQCACSLINCTYLQVEVQHVAN